MGAGVSNNVAKTAITSTTTILNSANQDCSQSTLNSTSIKFNNCPGSVVQNIKSGQNTVINVACMQNTNVKTQIEASVSSQMKQLAETATQSFGLPTVQLANNLSETLINLGRSVTNAYINTCQGRTTNETTIECENSAGIFVSDVNTEQTAQLLINCVQKDISVLAASENVKAVIDQSAVAKQENSLIALAVVAGIILVIFFVFMMM